MLKRILALIIFISLFGISYSQITIDYENPKEYTIKKIAVSGIKYLNKNALISISGLSVGQKVQIPGDEITDAVKKLWKQKMFSDVNINITNVEDDSISLDIYLQERPRLSSINFKGIKKSDKEDIEEAIGISRGSQITDNIIQKSENVIKNFYADKGFSKTKVKIYKKQDTTLQNAVILNIFVNKQGKTRIENINIEGNTVFSIGKIRRKSFKNTKRRRWWGFLKPSKYIRPKFEEDKKKLIADYNKKGYRDAKIVVDSVYDDGEKNVSIYVKVFEGRQYFHRNIKWIGNKKYSTELLQKRLKIKKGDVYDKEKLDNRLSVDEDAVGNLYMNNGYLFFNVTPIEIRFDNDSVDIELRIYEGEKARINKVIINGNDRTNDHIIRRELYTIPGELFSKSDIIRSIRELANLGHFDPENIIPTPIPNAADGTVDIEYSLVERGNDRFEISGGWGQGMLVGSIGLSFNNFSIHNIFDKDSWRPLPTGDGQTFSIRAQSNGFRYQSYSLSFSEPWLGGKKPISLTVSAYYNKQAYGWTKETAKNSNMKLLGGTIGMGMRLKWPDDYFTLYSEIGYQRYNLNNFRFNNIMNGIYNNITLKLVFGRSSISQPLYPRSGSTFSFGVELTPPYSLFKSAGWWKLSDEEKGMISADTTISNKSAVINDRENQNKFEWIEYHKWTFKASWFSQLIGDLVLNTKFEYGYLGTYSKGVGQSPFGGYSLGGDGMGYYSYGKDIIGLRGYKNGSLSPYGAASIYSKYTLEVRYPAILSQSANIYGLVFAEAGNSWYDFKDFNPFHVYKSLGIGVRIFLPMLGMFGIDWGYGFDRLPGASEPAGSQFHFVMGQQF